MADGSIVTQWLKTRPGGVEIAVVLGVAAAYLMVIVRMAIPVVERTQPDHTGEKTG